MRRMSGWLLVYALASIPVTLFYAAGLSGWLYDYPPALFAGLAFVFYLPVALTFFDVANVRAWNIASLWTGAALLTARIVHGMITSDIPANAISIGVLTGFVLIATMWATAWTAYFRKSARFARIAG